MTSTRDVIGARARRLAVPVLLSVMLGTWMPARAQCANPTLEVQPRGPLAPGQTVVVKGKFWTNECNDTCSPSCVGSDCEPPPEAPETGITLSIRQLDDRSGPGIVVAENIDASDDLTIRTTITIPDLPPGRYLLVGGDSEHAQSLVRIVIGP